LGILIRNFFTEFRSVLPAFSDKIEGKNYIMEWAIATARNIAIGSGSARATNTAGENSSK